MLLLSFVYILIFIDVSEAVFVVCILKLISIEYKKRLNYINSNDEKI